MRDYAVLSQEGYFVSSNMLLLSELIQEYDQYLELRWIPPDKRSEKDGPPYCIVHNPEPSSGMRPYVVFYVHEHDNPREVFARILAGDNWNSNVLERMEYRELAEKALRRKQRQEENLEAADLFHFLWTNRSGFYTKIRNANGEIVKLNGERRRC